MSVREKFTNLILDRWSSISFKAPMRSDAAGKVASRVAGWAPQTWVTEDHQRRLTAYMVLTAYVENVSRTFLDTTDPADRADRREYGDASLIVEQIRSHLLGDSQEIVVAGAELYDVNLTPPGDDATEQEQVDYTEALAANTAAKDEADLQAYLRAWAEKVHLPLRLVDLESNTVQLGDGVLLVGWDASKRRVIPTVMDPGCYFPVLPDTLDSYDYPTRVHFAWEIAGDQFPDGKARLRRITYELVSLLSLAYESMAEGGDGDDEGDGEIVLPEDSRWVRVTDGATETQELVRTYPWSSEPSRFTCVMTDATWLLDDVEGAVDALDPAKAEYRWDRATGELLDDVDLGIDFLPVVHVPNTPPGGEHYGQSSLARVLQILDDLQSADTDAQAASATTGSPIIGVSGDAVTGDDPLLGIRGKQIEVRPGEVWKLGSNGSISTVDTSAQLAATREYVKHLQDRLSVNSRLPASVLGTVKPSEVPSGFAMQLSFGPLTAMIRDMRLVRAVKYPLLLKMVTRIAQANGEPVPVGDTAPAQIQLGAFLPTDRDSVLAQVKDAYEAKLISLETSVRMLLEAGFPVDDVADEILLIQSRDFAGAGELADATNDQAAVREYLSMSTESPDDMVPPIPGTDAAGIAAALAAAQQNLNLPPAPNQ